MNSGIEKIRLLRKSELTGSAYFEFVPGGYTGNHWLDEAVYLTGEVFELIDSAFVKVLPNFGHYAPNEISRGNWELITNELRETERTLATAAVPADIREKVRLRDDFETLFYDHFDDARGALIKLIAELLGWLRAQLKKHERVSVLGI